MKRAFAKYFFPILTILFVATRIALVASPHVAAGSLPQSCKFVLPNALQACVLKYTGFCTTGSVGGQPKSIQDECFYWQCVDDNAVDIPSAPQWCGAFKAFGSPTPFPSVTGLYTSGTPVPTRTPTQCVRGNCEAKTYGKLCLAGDSFQALCIDTGSPTAGINGLVNVATIIGAFVAILMTASGGLKVATNGANTDAKVKSDGIDQIKNSLMGLGLILLARGAVYIAFTAIGIV